MKKRKRSDENFETKMEMTPMIDCVFLLIMFFILTTQITVNIEDVVLPVSREGKQDEEKDTGETMLILNVRKNRDGERDQRLGEIVYKGKVYDTKQLLQMLKAEAEYDASPEGRGRAWEEGPNGVKLSQMEILIRYDRSVKSEYLRTIFEQCQKAGIYKLKLATEGLQKL
jgi:biopolymer transport protein ExbD